MMSDDRFARAFDETIGDIKVWAAQHAESAEITQEAGPGFWRAVIAPHVTGACPAELILHRNQSYDITIGHETTSGRPIDNTRLFVSLLEAIAQGWVETRSWSTQATGRQVAVETIVTLAHGAQWSDRREIIAGVDQAASLQRRDQHYVPYARG